MDDAAYLQQTLELAAQGRGLVSPNPLVGSVVVKNDAIIGRGFHRYDELKHAEAWALEAAGAAARGATVYVNLEPCSHNDAGKRTSPCVQALIDAGVKRVVAAMVDPNPRVNGRGFEQLRDAGIEVEVGQLNAEAKRLNEVFIKQVTTGLPFVHWKAASSLDGRIATRTGSSQWITGEAARAAAQQLRHAYDAILIGSGTALTDNPLLTDRTGKARRRKLVRVVLDSSLRIPLSSRLVQSTREYPLLVFSHQAESAKRDALIARGAEVIECPRGNAQRLDLQFILAQLAARQLTSLLVEGGAEVAASFVAQKLLDKITLFVAPKLIGGRDAYPLLGGEGIADIADALRLRDLSITQHGEDFEVVGYLK
ncbi:MAG: bifunctional diaminohydroxyphosphoribosylaminopyrimidine deaminase/5-amino-6-(5-phosphoribosylamino)uracil reductase RibD [Acidobacteria bacterium]|nr:bifunctional diaminohydroxyphosphoribosylaminopyrimidine deaminase/5-amino-6-(5-phosphoribosylamino)uracil reductase RibD [Acidobacteriota bacterium]